MHFTSIAGEIGDSCANLSSPGPEALKFMALRPDSFGGDYGGKIVMYPIPAYFLRPRARGWVMSSGPGRDRFHFHDQTSSPCSSESLPIKHRPSWGSLEPPAWPCFKPVEPKSPRGCFRGPRSKPRHVDCGKSLVEVGQTPRRLSFRSPSNICLPVGPKAYVRQARDRMDK